MGRRRKPVEIVLPETFNVKAVGEWHDRFREALAKERPLLLNFSRVETLGIAGLQLVASLSKSCAGLGLEWECTGITDAVKDKIILSGMGKVLLKEARGGSV